MGQQPLVNKNLKNRLFCDKMGSQWNAFRFHLSTLIMRGDYEFCTD